MKKHNIQVDAINENIPGFEKFGYEDSRKVGADIYIDDKNLFFKNDWRLILEKLLKIYDQRDEK
ncbi:MAG: hypothetical protein ACOCRK_03020 [bacterium]